MNMNRTIADARENESNGYRVEVSGWDAEERFFVEKSTLVWSERTGKTVALKAVVHAGSVLFVRLTQPMGGGSGFPVPCRAVECEFKHGAAGGVLTLEQMQPRMALRERASSLVSPEPHAA
jgi:hypothetical protein